MRPIAHSLLGLIYREGGVYPVPFGPLAGARLRYDRSLTFHEMLGLWERAHIRATARALRALVGARPAIACDIGANVGLYALWLSRSLAGGSAIYAFEPAPAPFALLRRHLELNRAHNVRPVQLAVADRVGEVALFLGPDHHTASLDAERAGAAAPAPLTVASTTLDAFCAAEGGRWPDFIKVDIEGGGVRALPGFADCIERRRPLLLIESHTPAEDAAVGALALAHGYRAFRLADMRPVRSPTTTHPDPEGVWGTLLLYPAEAGRRAEGAIAGRRPAP